TTIKSSAESDGYKRLRMYRLHEPSPYRLPSGECFTGEILGVRPSGALVVRRTDDGRVGEYLFREIEFVLHR
ncbi:MAG: hypothetical protein K2J51_01225, partial [Alistipes sp.]|nr:hypothetical protein [Alistipes sp.]